MLQSSLDQMPDGKSSCDKLYRREDVEIGRWDIEREELKAALRRAKG